LLSSAKLSGVKVQGPVQDEITAIPFLVWVAALQWESLGCFWGIHPQSVLSECTAQGRAVSRSWLLAPSGLALEFYLCRLQLE